MLKKAIFPLVIVFSVTGIIVSYLYYQQQISSIAEDATTLSTTDQSEITTEEEVINESDLEDVYSSGWLGAYFDSEPSGDQHLVFVGSNAFESTESDLTWPSIVMDETLEAIAPTEMGYDVLTFSEETITSSLIDDAASAIIAAEPTLLIVESFSLNDNQYYLPFTEEESVENLATFLTHMENELPDIEIIVVPSNPFPNALHYLERKQVLDEQADSLPGEYVDHWQEWPTGAELETVIQNLRPNDEGQQIWADAFLEFFIDS